MKAGTISSNMRFLGDGGGRHLVPVVEGLVGTVDRDVEVLGLRLGEGGELDVQLRQVGTGDLFVEFLGEHAMIYRLHQRPLLGAVSDHVLDTKRELLRSRPEGNLGEDLVGERAGHDERRVASSATEVDEATFGEEDDVTAAGHGVPVDLRLDVDALLGVGLQPGDVDFNVEVANAKENVRALAGGGLQL